LQRDLLIRQRGAPQRASVAQLVKTGSALGTKSYTCRGAESAEEHVTASNRSSILFLSAAERFRKSFQVSHQQKLGHWFDLSQLLGTTLVEAPAAALHSLFASARAS
jgi:hypothetical protein